MDIVRPKYLLISQERLSSLGLKEVAIKSRNIAKKIKLVQYNEIRSFMFSASCGKPVSLYKSV